MPTDDNETKHVENVSNEDLIVLLERIATALERIAHNTDSEIQKYVRLAVENG